MKGKVWSIRGIGCYVGRSHRDRIDISRGGIRIVEEEEEEKYDECSVLERKGKWEICFRDVLFDDTLENSKI